jgi:hypothetical protein
MIEIRLINENPDSLWYDYANVIWIWISRKLYFKYESKKIKGQHRLYLGWIVIWWGMFHDIRKGE